MDDRSLDFGSFGIVEFDMDAAGIHSPDASCRKWAKKKARHGRAFLQTTQVNR